MSHRFFPRQIYNRRVWNSVQCRPPLVTGRNNKPLAFRLIFLCFHCPLGGKPEPFVLVWPLFRLVQSGHQPPQSEDVTHRKFSFYAARSSHRGMSSFCATYFFILKNFLKQFILMNGFSSIGFPSEWSGGYHLPYMAAAAAAGVNPFSHYGSPGKFN
jgi:hypothetical protein